MSDPEWLGGRPNQMGRPRLTAPDRDAAALAHARATGYFGEPITVQHAGRGWYDVTYTSPYSKEVTTRRNFLQVLRAPDQSRRGVDEGLARVSLAALHRPAWVIPEVNVSDGRFEGRADLLVLPDDGLPIAYEVKTERDTLTRLARQVTLYRANVTRCALACTPRHLVAARALLPEDWGLVELDPITHHVARVHREATPVPVRLPVVELLMYELWSSELGALLTERSVKHKSMNNTQRGAALRRLMTPEERHAAALAALAARTGTRVHATRQD